MAGLLEQIHIETRTVGLLRCQAALRTGGHCPNALECAFKRLPEDVALALEDVAIVAREIMRAAEKQNWSLCTDARGSYVVCGHCHRRERWEPPPL